MAKQPDIGNLASGFRSSNKLNSNFDEIKDAFDNTLSRDGSGPNEMLAPLDMNSERILNLPAPTDFSEPLRLGDIDTITAGTLLLAQNTPEYYGAFINLPDLNAAAFKRALESGNVIDGGGRTYQVTGSITALGATVKGLRNIKLVQTAPNTTTRTLDIRNAPGLNLYQVEVDCGGGFGVASTMFTSSGFYVYNCPKTSMVFCTAKNGGRQTGIHIESCPSSQVIGCYVTDFNYTGAASDDVIQGFFVNECVGIKYLANEATNLGYDTDNPLSVRRYSRGHTFAGTSECTVVGNRVSYVDQGFDVTGSNGNKLESFGNNVATYCGTYGFKVANSGSRIVFTGNLASDCGLMGYIISGKTEVSNPAPGSVRLIGCIALNTGSSGLWSASNPRGFGINVGGIDTTTPRNIKLIGCSAVDTQAVKTMSYGYTNDLVMVYGVWDNDTNQLINCDAAGYTTDAQTGFHFPYSCVAGSTTIAVPDNTWTSIGWDTERDDSSNLHSTSSNADFIFVREEGFYEISLGLTWATNATGVRGSRFIISGGTVLGSTVYAPALTGVPTTTNTTIRAYIPKGGNVRIEAFQTSGGSLNLTGTECNFTVTKC